MRRGAIRLAALAMLALGIALLAPRWFKPAVHPADTGGARLVHDAGGEPRLVVCLVNSARRALLRNNDAINQIVNTLPADTRILLLSNDRSAFTILWDDHPGRVEWLELPQEQSFTIWPQDPFLVLRDSAGRTRLLMSGGFGRADDALIAAEVAARLGAGAVPSSLQFEGGNIVSDERHVFVGADTIVQNQHALRLATREVTRLFEQELNQAVIVVGPSPQPVGHLDMVLTPLGNGRLALADSGWGADLAEESTRSNPAGVDQFEAGCESMFFGDARITELRTLDGKPIARPEVRGRTRQAIADSRKIADTLDEVARHLEGLGYRVERVPYLAVAPAQPEPDKPEVPQPAYPALTYNNVLLVNNAAGGRVYLPHYGFEALDHAAAQRWREIGFEVRPVGGLTISAMYGGSLRCSVKVIERAGTAGELP